MKHNDREVAFAVRSALADKVGAERFDLWFGADVNFVWEQGRLHVTSADKFLLEGLHRRFRAEISDVGRAIAGGEIELEFRVVDGPPPAAAPQPAPALHKPALPNPAFAHYASISAATRPVPGKPQSQRRHCDRRAEPCAERSDWMPFVVGPEHKVAQSCAEMILREPGRVSPLFVYGGTGSGKSHYLEMIRRLARQENQLRRVLSISAEQFTTQFLDALQGRSGMPSFRRKYRDLELLIIDDLQFFSGKRTTITELQNTVDWLMRERRQLVLAADRPPAELNGFSQDLLGRLAGGLVCGIPYPEWSTRRRILEQLAEKHGSFSADVLDLVATRMNGDVRQLKGAVHRLVAVREAHGGQLDLATATAMLDDLFRVTQKSVRLADIEQAVCNVFGIEKQALHAETRQRHVSQPRMLAMWLARKHTRAGLSEICRYFGRRSHSTVVSAERQVGRWLDKKIAVRLASGDYPIEDAIRRVEAQIRTG